jgi:hypothetical protein
MKIQLERNGEILDVKRLVIFINGNEFRLDENNRNELVINKAPLNDEQMFVIPSVGNEIKIK